MKSFRNLAFVAAAFLTATSPVMAADTFKGTNQNDFIESVGYDFIASAKNSGGVTSYRTVYSADVYTVTDSGNQFAAWLTKIGSNAKASTLNGWTYDASKAKISCQYSSSYVFTPGRVSSETLADNCQLANQ